MPAITINGKTIEAVGFGYDGCHKFYLIQDDEGAANVGHLEFYLLSALPRLWAQSCGLRFISNANLQGPSYVEQFETAVITYTEENHA